MFNETKNMVLGNEIIFNNCVPIELNLKTSNIFLLNTNVYETYLRNWKCITYIVASAVFKNPRILKLHFVLLVLPICIDTCLLVLRICASTLWNGIHLVLSVRTSSKLPNNKSSN